MLRPFNHPVTLLQSLFPGSDLVYWNNDVAVAIGTRPLVTKSGFTLAMDQRYSLNAADFSSLLLEIKSKDVDVVLVAGCETEILNFVRQAKSVPPIRVADLTPATFR
jgi:branched-chain amino acid transport system substrate-binding protein